MSVSPSLIFLIGILIVTTGCSEQKPSPAENEKQIGVQVYSVRNELSQNFDSTLAELAKIGFDQIEAYGLRTDGTLYGMEPSAYKRAVEKYGMELVTTHSDYFTAEDAPQMIEAAREAGVEYVIIPYIPNELRGDYDAIAQNLNEIGVLFKEAGIGFGYHNHDFEFFPTEDGRIPMEILIEGTDPDMVSFQLDLYWVVKAGNDPMEIINKYPGRFISFHVKDSDRELNQTTVGTGIVDIKTVLGNQERAGYKFYFVEDERVDAPLMNLKAGHDYLRNLDF
ncbi:MAG: sugar phosphate isomerase/epimerase [Balneolaceae bacterium]|nr:sugar phosphate isomerase/epimerase [Balneolaceae bacterium]MBO6546313.1 sugar phosphate isomerase/epimerase [Balneolaceae bacterium]MBO6648672.1 sugar phosphate isomerase/epimerase [Balneolaceae bacterium]